MVTALAAKNPVALTPAFKEGARGSDRSALFGDPWPARSIEDCLAARALRETLHFAATGGVSLGSSRKPVHSHRVNQTLPTPILDRPALL